LDAQREACEAYVLSQRQEGWRVLETQYDDGGYSGGSIERPALKQLLADIDARKIDVVVVYKVVRLTRSLADFARIVQVFDSQNVSFVSVTQQFNTTSSMGRLTLNVLLSFAQFEREVTGERIRDKIAASKRKGMWMGGRVPLGYDLIGKGGHIALTESALRSRRFGAYTLQAAIAAVHAETSSATSTDWAPDHATLRPTDSDSAISGRGTQPCSCHRHVRRSGAWALSHR
jgi:site-specific DNA recombinase